MYRLALGARSWFQAWELKIFRKTARPETVYSKPQKVGNRVKDKWCWDSLYITLQD